MTFVVLRDTDFRKVPRTGAANATPQTQLGLTGWYDWKGGVYDIQGGWIDPNSLPAITAGGTYTGAPNLISAAQQGAGSRKVSVLIPFLLTGTALTGYDLSNLAGTTTLGCDLCTLATTTISGGLGSGGTVGAASGTKKQATGTIGVTNSSSAVTTSADLTGLFVVGDDFTVGNDAAHTYSVKAITSSSVTLGTFADPTVSQNFQGTTNAATTAWYGGNCVGPFANLNSLTPTSTGVWNGYLVCAKSIATVDQQFDAYFTATQVLTNVAIVLRYNDATGTVGEGYLLNVNNSSGGNISIFYCNGTTASTLATHGGLSPNIVLGHDYRLRASAVNAGTTTCTLTVELFDVTTSTSIYTLTTTDSTAVHTGVASAGQLGIANIGSQGTFTRLTAWNASGNVISPGTLVLNQTAVTLNVSNPAASWLVSAPVFSVSGTNATLVPASTVVTGATSATVQINTGSTPGVITLHDATTGGDGTTISVAMTPPGALVAVADITSSGTTVTASAVPANLNGPYAAALYRSPNSAFVYNDGSATLVSTQTGISAAAAPTAVVDTTAPTGPQFYRWVLTDNTGQIGSGTQAGAQRYVDPAITVMCIGDSNTNGHNGTAWTQWANEIGVITRGSGQTDGTYDVTHATNTQFLGKVIIVGGLIQRAWVSRHSFGITSETVPGAITYTGAGGTPGTLSLVNTTTPVYTPAGNVGGGFVLAAEVILRTAYKFRNVRMRNQGVGGSAASSWAPHGTVYISNATNASPIAITTKSAHGLSSGTAYPIRRVQGNTAANGTYYVSVSDATHFTLYSDAGLSVPVAGNGAYVSDTGGVIGPGTSTGVTGYNLENAKSQAVDAATTPIWHIMLGANDANGGVSQALYQQEMDFIVNDLILWGATRVMVSDYFYWVPTASSAATEAKNLLLQQYAVANTALVAAFPGRCIHGMTSLYGMTLDYPFLLGSDGLHGNDAGYGAIGGVLAAAVAPVVSLVRKIGSVLFI